MEKKRILIVEDDAVLANAFQISLMSLNSELGLAKDGDEATQMIEGSPWDMILLDLLLPKKNGLEVLRWMRGDERFKKIKVIVLTNFEQENAMEEAMSLGALDYVVKANIDIKDVPVMVKKYLNEDGKE